MMVAGQEIENVNQKTRYIFPFRHCRFDPVAGTRKTAESLQKQVDSMLHAPGLTHLVHHQTAPDVAN